MCVSCIVSTWRSSTLTFFTSGLNPRSQFFSACTIFQHVYFNFPISKGHKKKLCVNYMCKDCSRITINKYFLGPLQNISYSNMTSFFCFVKKRAIYRLGIISLAHAPVHVTDFPVVNVHVNELSSARIWQHKLCTTLSTNVNINYRLPIKVYYGIYTLRYIRIEIIHGSQNVFGVLTWVGGSANPC
jgi:hypothetical protein